MRCRHSLWMTQIAISCATGNGLKLMSHNVETQITLPFSFCYLFESNLADLIKIFF